MSQPLDPQERTRRSHDRIKEQPSARLKSCISYTPNGSFDFSNQTFSAFAGEFHAGINLPWIVARIAETLYERGDIDEREFDRITEMS